MIERWIRSLPSNLEKGAVALTDVGTSVFPAPDAPSELSLHRDVCWWRGPRLAYRLRLVGPWSFFPAAEGLLGFHPRAQIQMGADTASLRPRVQASTDGLPYGAGASPHHWRIGGVDLWCDAGFAYLRSAPQRSVVCLGKAKRGLPGPEGSFLGLEPELSISCRGARALAVVEAPCEPPFLWEADGQAVWGLVDGEPVRICALTGSIEAAERPAGRPRDGAQNRRCFADGIRCEAELTEGSVLHRWTREGARLSENYSSSDNGPS